MATTTATILIGRAHQNDSGINPTHFIQFTENDRPALILQAIEGESKKDYLQRCVAHHIKVEICKEIVK